MRNLLMTFAMLIALMLVVTSRANAQCCGIGDRLERVGTIILERGSDIIIVRDTNRTNEQINRDSNRTAERINRDNNQTAERINNRQMDSWDRQTAAQENIALEEQRTRRMETTAQRDMENTRVAGELCRESATCTATASSGRVTVTRVERPPNGNGPMVR